MKTESKKTTTQFRRRLDIMVSPDTIELLDRVAPKGTRSRFIEQAVRFFIGKRAQAKLRAELKKGALARAKLDRQLAEEWAGIDAKVWEKYGV